MIRYICNTVFVGMVTSETFVNMLMMDYGMVDSSSAHFQVKSHIHSLMHTDQQCTASK